MDGNDYFNNDGQNGAQDYSNMGLSNDGSNFSNQQMLAMLQNNFNLANNLANQQQQSWTNADYQSQQQGQMDQLSSDQQNMNQQQQYGNFAVNNNFDNQQQSFQQNFNFQNDNSQQQLGGQPMGGGNFAPVPPIIGQTPLQQQLMGLLNSQLDQQPQPQVQQPTPQIQQQQQYSGQQNFNQPPPQQDMLQQQQNLQLFQQLMAFTGLAPPPPNQPTAPSNQMNNMMPQQQQLMMPAPMMSNPQFDPNQMQQMQPVPIPQAPPMMQPPHLDVNNPQKSLEWAEPFAGKGKKEPPFPLKLHQILSNSEFSECIAWSSHGKSWRILKPPLFEQLVIPLYFRHAKYASFMRQVNGWGFKRIVSGNDHNSYYHEYFLRDFPQLCLKMKRIKKEDKKKAAEKKLEDLEEDDSKADGDLGEIKKEPETLPEALLKSEDKAVKINAQTYDSTNTTRQSSGEPGQFAGSQQPQQQMSAQMPQFMSQNMGYIQQSQPNNGTDSTSQVSSNPGSLPYNSFANSVDNNQFKGMQMPNMNVGQGSSQSQPQGMPTQQTMPTLDSDTIQKLQEALTAASNSAQNTTGLFPGQQNTNANFLGQQFQGPSGALLASQLQAATQASMSAPPPGPFPNVGNQASSGNAENNDAAHDEEEDDDDDGTGYNDEEDDAENDDYYSDEGDDDDNYDEDSRI